MEKYTVRKQYLPRKSRLKSVEKVEGETIEEKVRRIMLNKEPIKDGAPEIFTERKDGVISAYNIRADRWEIATDAMDAVTKSRLAKRDGKMEIVKDEPTDKSETKKEQKTELGESSKESGA